MAAVAGIVILVGASSVLAQDWPQWRGPNRNGKLSGFAAPASWPKELTQKWKVPVGVGDSSPALVGNKLYAFGRQDANEVISCIDAVSGKVLWQEIYPAQFVATGPSSRHPGTRSSPIVVEGKLCVLGIGGILSCVDAATGIITTIIGTWFVKLGSSKNIMGAMYNGLVVAGVLAAIAFYPITKWIMGANGTYSVADLFYCTIVVIVHHLKFSRL